MEFLPRQGNLVPPVLKLDDSNKVIIKCPLLVLGLQFPKCSEPFIQSTGRVLQNRFSVEHVGNTKVYSTLITISVS